MLEKEIEAYLVRRAKKLGGIAYKFISPGRAGVPDRMVCLPGGSIAFVELKAPGETSRPRQLAQQRLMKALGFRVYSDIDSKQAVDALLEGMIQA